MNPVKDCQSDYIAMSDYSMNLTRSSVSCINQLLFFKYVRYCKHWILVNLIYSSFQEHHHQKPDSWSFQ